MRFSFLPGIFALAATHLFLWVSAGVAQPLDLILPTRNLSFYSDEASFYQFTDRYYRGVKSSPWEGGQYGFVRNLKDTPAGIVYTRFHEGMDIKPLYRDRRGEPLDTVRSIDDGKVVYANYVAKESTYGKYVVVEHLWDKAPFYSLYAHLGDIHVTVGQRVRQGQRLGRIGYTGRGIDKRRAHVHFEINMLLNQDFDRWYGENEKRSDNPHRRFHGFNLAGMDVAALYQTLEREPGLTITEFIRRQPVFFEVTTPSDYTPDLLYRYPFLVRGNYNPDAPSVTIGFTQSGTPAGVASSYRRTTEPYVSWVRPSDVNYNLVSNRLLTGSSRFDVSLSSTGDRLLDVLLYPTAVTRSGAALRLPPSLGPSRVAILPPAELNTGIRKPIPHLQYVSLPIQHETLGENYTPAPASDVQTW